jgi:hypothetical protein
MASAWLRLSAETSNDPKLIGIAAVAKVPFVVVLGLWTHLLCRARKNEAPGTFTETPSELACVMGMDESTVIEIMAHFEFHKRNLIEGNRIAKWDKYQKASDSSSDRVARWRASKKPAEKKEEVKQKQRVGDVVTLHREVHPNVKAAGRIGTKIMKERGVFERIEVFSQLTSPLTPLFDAGIPESFVEETINRVWDMREAKNSVPNNFQYYVPAVKRAWDDANQKLEGTIGNVKQPSNTATSRNTGEDVESRREAILEGLGFAPSMESRRTGSF